MKSKELIKFIYIKTLLNIKFLDEEGFNDLILQSQLIKIDYV